ncbi:conjugative transfer signal peptidase TraF [Cupriavidus basilensis]
MGVGVSLAYNTSPSMPRGLYLTVPVKQYARGMLAAICLPKGAAADLYRARHYLPESTRCSSGVAPVLKPVAGVAGDVVGIDHAGVSINGAVVPNSAVLDTDSQGAGIPHLPVGWQTRLAPGQVFALATHAARSLDSRYYGVLPDSQIIARAFPIFLLDKEQ